MSRNKRKKERDSKIVLRDVYSIYHDFLNSEELYKELYSFFSTKSVYEISIIKAEIESDEASQEMLSVRISAMALITSFLALLINIMSINLDIKQMGTVLRTLLIITLSALLCYCIKTVGDVILSFLNRHKKGKKRNKYILCVLADILDIRKQNVIGANGNKEEDLPISQRKN